MLSPGASFESAVLDSAALGFGLTMGVACRGFGCETLDFLAGTSWSAASTVFAFSGALQQFKNDRKPLLFGLAGSGSAAATASFLELALLPLRLGGLTLFFEIRFVIVLGITSGIGGFEILRLEDDRTGTSGPSDSLGFLDAM